MKDYKEKLESAIHALTDIKESLQSDGEIDGFIKKWALHNSHVPTLEKDLREIYAEQCNFAISILKCCLEKS